MSAKRCFGEGNSDYERYHDEEWGVPAHDERKLFEMLILEGAQAGLSWLTILKRRDGYRKAFDNFDVNKVAKYDEVKIGELMQDNSIIRNRLKIISAIKNAKAFLQIQKEFGSFDNFIWSYVGSKPIINRNDSNMRTTSEVSDKISKELKRRGMNFIGSTIIYSFMQAIGMVNDHFVWCKRHKEIS